MNLVLHFLNSEAFHVLGESTTWAELFGFITGAFCVWLVAIQHIINWPLGIANGAFYLLLFITSGLYADSGLQIFYIVLGFYGWWAWLYGGERRSTLHVSRTTGHQWVVLVLLSAVGMIGIFELLARATPSTVPFWDALTTILSLAATWGQCRKKLENWWLWIAADIIYIPLYLQGFVAHFLAIRGVPGAMHRWVDCLAQGICSTPDRDATAGRTVDSSMIYRHGLIIGKFTRPMRAIII